jgi:hypothetical protein
MQQRHESNKELSTTNLAKELKISTHDMFQKLLELELIARNNTGWDLTQMGKSKGGVYKNSDKFGRYIVWPTSIKVELERNSEDEKPGLLTATSIGKTFNISATRTNSILSELGWIKKDAIKGWHLTELGTRLGGLESKYATSGVSFVRWPDRIIKNEILVSNIRQASGDVSQAKEEESYNKTKSDPTEFREKYRAEHRAKDGHYVRSKAELIIDNTLYDYKIVHAYERKLPIEEDVYCDFYIPTGKVYIEYWGLDEEKYLANKKRKLEVYSKYNFNLIQLLEKDVSNLEDTLPAKLLDFGIGVE